MNPNVSAEERPSQPVGSRVVGTDIKKRKKGSKSFISWSTLRKIARKLLPCIPCLQKKKKKRPPGPGPDMAKFNSSGQEDVRKEVELSMVENPLRSKLSAKVPNSPSRQPLIDVSQAGNAGQQHQANRIMVPPGSVTSGVLSSRRPSIAPNNPLKTPPPPVVSPPTPSSQSKPVVENAMAGPPPPMSMPASPPAPSARRKTIVEMVTGVLYPQAPATPPSIPRGKSFTETSDDTGSESADKRLRSKSIVNTMSRLMFGAQDGPADEEKATDAGRSAVFEEYQTGWLYRENELSQQERDEQVWIKKWVCIVDKRLLYAETKPQGGIPTVAQGYIDLLPGTSVKFTHLEKAGVATSESKGQNCFMVKEQNDADNTAAFSITWSAASTKDRDAWVAAIKAAIDAPSADSTNTPKSTPPLCISPVDEKDIDISAAELPTKVGMLKKHAIGSFMGVKTIKTRWFRLEGGELRYYADQDMRPSKLKGTINLYGSVLLDTSETTEKEIHLQLARDSSGAPSLLVMEASTPKEAKEWHFALKETILAQKVRGRSSLQVKRRQNLADLSSKVVVEAKKDAESKHWAESRLEPRTEKLITDCMNGHFLMKKTQNSKGLINSFKPCVRLPGDIIISQGSAGDFFYLLESGSASVLKDGKKIGVVPAGKSFGDLALLNSSARTATVRAGTICKLWTLDRQTLRTFLAEQERKELTEKMEFLRSVKLFEQISDYTLEKIAEVMQQQTFDPKQVIFRRGEAGESFYMVQSGRVSIFTTSITGGRTELVRLGNKKFFGELALLDNAPRKASAAAIDKTTCWTVDRSNFIALVGSVKQAREESIGVQILKKVKLMEGLTDKQLITVARCLKPAEFKKGDAIINQGEDGDTFYMIAQGEVNVEINHVQVAHLGDSAFFGEGSLIKNEKRSATVIACTDVACLCLSRDDFNRLLGPIAEEVKAESARRAAAAAASKRGLFQALESGFESLFSSSELATGLKSSRDATKELADQALLATTNKLFDLDQLDRVHTLGRGTFATVYLVRHTQNDTFYALKVLHKHQLHKTRQERVVFAERDMMKMFDHPFFTALYATFQDQGSLYLVQELVPCGDVYDVIHNYNYDLDKTRLGGLHPELASFYAANLLIVLGHLADKDVVFRDLKPENFGIDTSGYLRIYDFGCAKVLVGEETSNTMVGTPEYLSPEMITSKGHGRGVDIWSLGVFIYEMLTARTPFDHANKALVYQNVMNSNEELNVAFTKDFDADAKDLIRRLLVPNPHMRLGMLRQGLADVWAHPFISRGNKNERQIGLKNVPAPYKPKMSDFSQADINDVVIGNFDSDDVPSYEGSYDFSNF